MKILVADDNPETARRITALLEEAGFQAIGPARDGGEALRLFEEHQPEGALLDITMPVLSGLAVAKSIRARCRECMILMFTGHRETSIMEAGLDAGANAVLHKSTDFQHVVSLLRTRQRLVEH